METETEKTGVVVVVEVVLGIVTNEVSVKRTVAIVIVDVSSTVCVVVIIVVDVPVNGIGPKDVVTVLLTDEHATSCPNAQLRLLS